MRKDLTIRISDKLNITDRSMMEKDIILHEILKFISSQKYVTDNYLFKGGTCLAKAYVDYARFSVDLDFTWRNQKAYEGMSGKGTLAYISEQVGELGVIIEKAAKVYGLDFDSDKSNTRYTKYGGSGRMVTLFVWYMSEILNQESVIKVQFNFVEDVMYEPEIHMLASLVSGDDSLKSEIGDHPYFEEIPFPTYSIKEILCEKIRAILTRRTAKARDYFDCYMIYEKYGIEIVDILDNAITKTKLSISMYEKYKKNIQNKATKLQEGDNLEWGDEKHLLLKEIDEKKFNAFNKQLERTLKEDALPHFALK